MLKASKGTRKHSPQPPGGHLLRNHGPGRVLPSTVTRAGRYARVYLGHTSTAGLLAQGCSLILFFYYFFKTTGLCCWLAQG